VRSGPYDYRVMEQVGSDDEDFLAAWRRGRGERRDLYEAVRAPMRQAARQGIGSITASTPDSHDVDDAVYDAFLELERQDPANVVSVVGLANRIAYRRGQDTGRKIIRQREQMHSMVIDLVITADPQFQDDDVRAAAEAEVLLSQAMECMEVLTEEQRDVVRATIMERENLSDWALRVGKTHQAASRQRTRALESLRRCVASKESPNDGGGER
jgi:DNA-directed RNA polymerase specialized sigma24 family protein